MVVEGVGLRGGVRFPPGAYYEFVNSIIKQLLIIHTLSDDIGEEGGAMDPPLVHHAGKHVVPLLLCRGGGESQ